MTEEHLSPYEATVKAMTPDHLGDHRHHAGARRRVRADGVLPRLDGRHLSAVLGDARDLDRVLRAAGADADAGAVRDAAQAARAEHDAQRRAIASSASSTRFFGGFNGWFARTTDRYQARRRPDPARGRCASSPCSLALVAVTLLLFLRLPGSFLPAEDQGVRDHRRPGAAGRDHRAHERSDRAGEGVLSRAAAGAERRSSCAASASSVRARRTRWRSSRCKPWEERTGRGEQRTDARRRAIGALSQRSRRRWCSR